MKRSPRTGSVTRHVDRYGRDRWHVRLTYEGRRISLGLHESEDEAHDILAAALEQLGVVNRSALRPPERTALAQLRQLKPIPWPGCGGVYYALAARLVKIGYAKRNIGTRLAGLQIGCPARIRLVAHAAGGSAEESAAHLRFSDLRAHGEWFRPSEKLVAEVLALRGALPMGGGSLATLTTGPGAPPPGDPKR